MESLGFHKLLLKLELHFLDLFSFYPVSFFFFKPKLCNALYLRYLILFTGEKIKLKSFLKKENKRKESVSINAFGIFRNILFINIFIILSLHCHILIILLYSLHYAKFSLALTNCVVLTSDVDILTILFFTVKMLA